jgi:hypothetical protein
VAKRTPASDERLDELYREPPGEFVAGRNRLARELRDGGDREASDRVKRLRRPTVAAWVINRVALTSPKLLEELAAASAGLEDAQRRALEGKDEGAAEWRAAAQREQEATEAVVEAAEASARDAGHPPSARAMELVADTLRAAAADADLRGRVVAGRVEREQSAATLGTPLLAPSSKRAAGGSTRRREATRARRERERLEEELAEATEREERLRAQVERSASALRDQKARLADAKREATALRRRVKGAGGRASR